MCVKVIQSQQATKLSLRGEAVVAIVIETKAPLELWTSETVSEVTDIQNDVERTGRQRLEIVLRDVTGATGRTGRFVRFEGGSTASTLQM